MIWAQLPESGSRSTRSPYYLLVLMSAMALIVSFSESMLIPALPTIQAEYQASEVLVSWVPAIYLMVGAVATPIFGKLGDIYGKKRVLMISLCCYSLAVLADGFSWDIGSLLLFRGVQGIGLGMFPLSISLIRDQFPPHRVAAATGAISSMNGVGASIGLVGGAFITQQFTWKTNYHILAPFAVIVTCLALLLLAESPIRTKGRIDYIGSLLLSVSIVSVLMALSGGGRWGWTSLPTLGLIGTALTSTAILIRVELYCADPLIDLKIPRLRDIMTVNVMMFISGLLLFLSYQSIIYFAQEPNGFALDIISGGLIVFPAAFSMLIIIPVAARVVQRRGPKRAALIGSAAMIAGTVAFMVFPPTVFLFAVNTVILFIGVGFEFIALITYILAAVPQTATGTQTGLNSIFRFIGQSAGAVMAGVVMAAFSVDNVPRLIAYQYIGVIALVLACISLLMTFAIPDLRMPERQGAVAAAT